MIHKKEGNLVLSFLCPCRAGKIPVASQALDFDFTIKKQNRHIRRETSVCAGFRLQLRKILVSQSRLYASSVRSRFLPREQCRDTADGLIPSRSAHCLQDNPSTSIIHSTSYCRGVSCSRMARKKAVRNACRKPRSSSASRPRYCR